MVYDLHSLPFPLWASVKHNSLLWLVLFSIRQRSKARMPRIARKNKTKNVIAYSKRFHIRRVFMENSPSVHLQNWSPPLHSRSVPTNPMTNDVTFRTIDWPLPGYSVTSKTSYYISSIYTSHKDMLIHR